MTHTIPITDLIQPKATQVEVEIFDPPMCCPTGMCGPTIDQTLLDLSEMVLELRAQGINVARYQMTSHPNAFLSNPEVMKLVREQQMAVLPITVVHGKVIKTQSYPSLDEVKTHLNGAAA